MTGGRSVEKCSTYGQPSVAVGGYQLSKLREDLGLAYVYAGRRQDALSLIDAELKKKPLSPARALWVVKLMSLLGMGQTALEVARLAEFTAEQDAPSIDRSSRQIARNIVDSQLRRLGLFKELRDRVETRRALGEPLRIAEYVWMGTIFYQGEEAVAILDEGVKKYPESVELLSDYMQLLSRVGRKEAAWNAYEKGRDLYFAQVDRNETPTSPGDGIKVPPMSPTFVALPWYSYLLKEGKDDEFHRLEDRLREACAKTRTEPKSLLLPRAVAEFGARRYAAAAKSLEICLQERVWNDVASEAMITTDLARSLYETGQRQAAIKFYRRAVQISEADPGLLSEFFSLALKEGGAIGLLQEVSALDQSRLGQDPRVNATIACINSWVFLVGGNEKTAFEYLVQAVPLVLRANQQPGQPLTVQSTGGKLVFEKKASLEVQDPTEPSPSDFNLTSHRKTYTFNMKAGYTYTIDLLSKDKTGKQLDPFLRLESPEGKRLAEDDDGAGFPNSRIVYKAIKDGDYRIIATSFPPNQTGAFTLQVFEAQVKDAPVSSNPGGNDRLVCAVILQIVSERLGDAKRVGMATDILRRFPPAEVRAVREIYLLPKQK